MPGAWLPRRRASFVSARSSRSGSQLRHGRQDDHARRPAWRLSKHKLAILGIIPCALPSSGRSKIVRPEKVLQDGLVVKGFAAGRSALYRIARMPSYLGRLLPTQRSANERCSHRVLIALEPRKQLQARSAAQIAKPLCGLLPTMVVPGRRAALPRRHHRHSFLPPAGECPPSSAIFCRVHDVGPRRLTSTSLRGSTASPGTSSSRVQLVPRCYTRCFLLQARHRHRFPAGSARAANTASSL